MKHVLNIMAALISLAATSCAGQPSSGGVRTTVIDSSVLDSATVLLVDSTDHRFDPVGDAHVMLVYRDSLLIASNSDPTYGEPIVSLYGMGEFLHHLADYIPRGSEVDEMVACHIQVMGDKLFVNDCYYTGRYCTLPLHQPLLPADELHLSHSGVEERGVATVPCRDGLLVENPQCYTNVAAGIRNDVPRLLFYKQGVCLTPQQPVAYQVADVNTGADIHCHEALRRVCFVSHRQPLVEFYDDIPERGSSVRGLSLRLVHRLSLQSDDVQKIHVGAAHTTMHQKRARGDRTSSICATFDKTQRVVGAGSQLHAFLCSAADEEHIYLVYCGKLFSHGYHTYPTCILVLDWDGNLVDAYRFDRWIQAISPSSERGTFYLTVYADDDPYTARMKLVKAVCSRTQ